METNTEAPQTKDQIITDTTLPQTAPESVKPISPITIPIPKQKPNPKKVTYDSILERMGMFVHDNTLHKMSPDPEYVAPIKSNKQPKNIPTNMYHKYNKYYTQNPDNKNKTPTIPRPVVPTMKEARDKLIRTIVHNVLVKNQKKTKPNNTLVLY